MSDFSTNYSSARTDKGLEAQVRDGVISKTKNLQNVKRLKRRRKKCFS